MLCKLSAPAWGLLSVKVATRLNLLASRGVSSILKTLALMSIFAASMSAAHFSFLDSLNDLVGTSPERSIVSLDVLGPMANFYTISPSTQNATAGSSNAFVWTFTATNTNSGGPLLFTVPLSWPVPNTGGGNGTVAIGGTCSGILQIVAQQISVDQVGTGAGGSCGTGQTITISYTLLAVPTPASPPQTYTFQSNFGSSPTVTVFAPGVPTSTTVVSSINPSTYGQGVTFTATVSPVPSGGTIDFNVSASSVCTGVAVNGSGQAFCNTNAVTANGSPHAVTANYSGTTGFFSSTGTLNPGQTVQKANQVAALTAPSAVGYDGAPHSPTVACSGGGAAFNILINGVGSQISVGAYAVTASCPVNSNYNGGINLFAGNYTITPATQTATLTAPTTAQYDGSPHSATVICSGGGAAFNILTGGATTQTNAGTYGVVADCPAAGPNFGAGSGLSAGNFSITPINQTATVAAPTSVPYNGSPRVASVACSGGGAAFNIGTGGLASQTNVGVYGVTADCPAVAPNYNLTTGVTASGAFAISPTSQTASVTAPQSVPYDGSAHTATVSCAGGGAAFNILLGGFASQTSAATYPVTADCPAAAPNYTQTLGVSAGNFTITAITQTASVTAPSFFPYNGNPRTATVACSGGGIAFNILMNGAASQTNAGVYPVVADCPAAAPNYTASSNLSAGFYFISPVSQTASLGAPTSVAYDGSPHGATVICSGGGTATNIQLGGFATQTSAASYPVTADCPSAPNYTPTGGINAGFFTITAIDQTASLAAPASIPYDGSPHEAVVLCSGGGAGVNVMTGGTATQTDAGSYMVVADCPSAPNYNPTSGLSAGTFLITAITQTASVTAPTSIPYDGSPHSATVTCTSGGSASNIITGGAATQTNAGVYAATADCPGIASNYISGSNLPAGNFVITPITQTASVNAPLSLPYDGSPHSAAVTCSGGGIATNILTGGASSQTAAGSYAVTTDCPTAAPNYAASLGVNAGFYTLTPVNQTASVTAPASVAYDGSPHGATVLCSGGGSGFNILTGGSASQINAGVFAVIADCPAAPNYNATPSLPAGNFTITAANQTASVAAPTSVPYDGLAHGAAVTCSGGGTAVNILTGGSATKINAGDYSVTADCPAAAPNYNASVGLAAGNFTITAVDQTAIVTAPLSVLYDGLPHSATVSCSGGGLASNISTGGSPTQTNAGTYAVTANCPAAAPNYNASAGVAAGNFIITKAGSSTSISCPASVSYTGAPLTPCTALVTRVANANTTTPITYGNNTNPGTATANATYPGDVNHAASAPATQATFQITFCPVVSAPTITLQSGSAVIIPINTTALPSGAVISADFTFTYDSAKMIPFAYPNAVTAGSVASSAVVTYSESPGILKVSLFDPGSFSGSGALVNLHFNVVGPSASVPLTLSGLLYNGGMVCSSTSNGTLNIESGAITGQVTYAHSPFIPVPGVLLDAPGSPHISDTTNASGAYSLTGFGTSAYTVTPSKPDVLYNDSLLVRGIFVNDATLVAQHVVGLITLNPTQLQAAKVSGFSTLTSFDAALIAQWIVNTTPANPVNQTGKWKFNPGNGGTFVVNTHVTQNYTAILMGDVSGGWPNFVPRPALDQTGGLSADTVRASVPNVEAASRSEITVPFRIDNLGDKGVTSYQFDIEYDPAILAPVTSAASVNGTFSDGLTVVSNSPEAGLLKVAVFGALPVNGDGVYANLRFTAIGVAGATSPLIIREFRFNNGDDSVTTIGGRVTVTPGMSGVSTATINGKLSTSLGSGVTNARVILTRSNLEQRSVLSGPMGYFSFDGLVVGENYTVSVQAKRYTFAPRNISIADNAVTEINMMADQ